MLHISIIKIRRPKIIGMRKYYLDICTFSETRKHRKCVKYNDYLLINDYKNKSGVETLSIEILITIKNRKITL